MYESLAPTPVSCLKHHASEAPQMLGIMTPNSTYLILSSMRGSLGSMRKTMNVAMIRMACKAFDGMYKYAGAPPIISNEDTTGENTATASAQYRKNAHASADTIKAGQYRI